MRKACHPDPDNHRDEDLLEEKATTNTTDSSFRKAPLRMTLQSTRFILNKQRCHSERNIVK